MINEQMDYFNYTNKRIILILLFGLVFITVSSIGTVSATNSSVIYVNGSHGNDDWDGLSWEFAKKTIRNATGTVAEGGIVNIADGTYTGEYENTNIIIDKNMTLNGQSRNGTIINGAGSAWLFQIQSGKSVTIQNLTLANGNDYYGSAIFNWGNLTVKNCNFTNNFASGDGGAIWNNAGTLTVINSTFTFNRAGRNGGAIYNEKGTLTVINSTFTNNNAVKGGAICNGDPDYPIGSDLTVSHSIFTGNSAISGDGGAVWNNIASNLTVNNSTFTGNHADYNGGAINNWHTLTVNSSTFENNSAGKGGAIWNFGTSTFSNSTFSGNTANDGGSIMTSGTLIVNNSTFANNQATNYGGAIYNGGTLNVNGSAFEVNTATKWGGAIYSAQDLTVSNCTFIGNNAANGGAIYKYKGNLTVNSSTFTYNTASYGGAIYNTGNLNISGSNFTNNNANSSSGGAIWNQGPLTVNGSTFANNLAHEDGGAIWNNYRGISTVNNSTFANNNASSGGAIYNYNADMGVFHVILDVNECTFTNNTVSSDGGAIYNGNMVLVTELTLNQVELNVDNSTFRDNHANGNGGAIYNYSAYINIDDPPLTLAQTAVVNVKYSTFTGNSAGTDSTFNYVGTGGAISSRCTVVGDNSNIAAALNVTDSTFTNNTATNRGGAIYTDSVLEMEYSIFTDNTADKGGAIHTSVDKFYCNVCYNIIAGNNDTEGHQISGKWDGNYMNFNYNWWGLNDPPRYGTITNWLVLTITTNPATINTGGTSTVTVDLLHDKYGHIVDNLIGHFLNGIGKPVTFTITNPSLGSLNPTSSTMVNCQATSTFIASASGTAYITSTVHNQTVSTQITIKKSPTHLIINNTSGIKGQTINLTATLTDGNNHPLAGKNVNFAVNGIVIGSAVTDSDGKAVKSYIITENVGSYSIVAQFAGDTGHINSDGTGTLTVNKTPTNLALNNSDGFNGQTVNLIATLIDHNNNPLAGRQINFMVNGSSIGSAMTNTFGVATLPYTITLAAGTYPILAQFAGDVEYLSSNGSGSLTVNLIPTSLTVNSASGYNGDTVNINAILRDNHGNLLDGKGIDFTIGNDPAVYHIQTVAGIANLVYKIVQYAGTYSIRVAFAGDSKYTGSSSNGALTVDKTPTSIGVDPAHNFAGQTVNLVAHITDYYGNPVNSGQIRFTVGIAAPVTANVVIGEARVDNWQIPFNWAVNNYQILAEFLGTSELLTNSSIDILTVDKTPTNLKVNNNSGLWHQYVDITANLTDYYGNPVNGRTVTFTIAGNPNIYSAVTDSNGLATLHYQIVQNAGTYGIYVEFAGNSEYSGSSGAGSLAVNLIPTSLTVNSTSGYKGDNTTLTATLTANGNPVAGKTVTFTVGNWSSNATTDINGVASVTYPITQNVGTYLNSISAIFAADNQYTESKDTNTLTVNSIPTRLTVENVVGNKGYSVDLKATLWDTAHDKAVSGKQVDFYVKSIKVGSAITDANGVAILPYAINLVGGSYTINAEFIADTQYSNGTENGTLKVPQSSIYVFTKVSKNNPAIGETITITFKLGNNGPDKAENVVFTYIISKGLQFMNIRGEGDYSYDLATRTVTWNLGNVPVGDPYLYVLVKPLHAGNFNINPEVSVLTYDPDLAKNLHFATIGAVKLEAHAASKTQKKIKTITMQKTGLSVNYLILAFLMVFGGLLSSRRYS